METHILQRNPMELLEYVAKHLVASYFDHNGELITVSEKMQRLFIVGKANSLSECVQC